jgi:hypothetical protein
MLPSKVGDIPLTDYSKLKYLYDQKRMIHQRLEVQVGYLAYLVGILFSKTARYKRLKDFLVFEERTKTKPATNEQIINSCGVLFRNKSEAKPLTQAEIEYFDKLIRLQAIYDGEE